MPALHIAALPAIHQAAAHASSKSLGSPLMQVLVVLALVVGIYCLATAKKTAK